MFVCFIFIINPNEYLNPAQDPTKCDGDAWVHDWSLWLGTGDGNERKGKG